MDILQKVSNWSQLMQNTHAVDHKQFVTLCSLVGFCDILELQSKSMKRE
jgi:hypothetical protein